MIAHRWDHSNPLLKERIENRGLVAAPHRLKLGIRQADLLAGDHVAGAKHQIWFQLRQQIKSLSNGCAVVGRPIRTIEITDQGKAKIPSLRADHCFGTFFVGGCMNAIKQPSTHGRGC